MPGQVYSVSTLGGNHSVPYLSERIRSLAQPEYRLRQFVDVQEAIGKGRGDTWLFNKTGNVQTQGGILVETNTIPETQFVTNQGTGTINEYGNAIPWTTKMSMLGQFSLEPMVEQKLRDDMVKVLESACGNEFVKTEFVAVQTATNGVAFTTNGTATATASANFTATNVRQIVDFLKKKNIPRYDGRNFICVASTAAISGMYGDTGNGGWVDISKYTDTYARNLFEGEVGTYYNMRFVEETGFLSNTIGLNSLQGQAVVFGSDNIYEAVSVPEEIRMKVSTDYGRDNGLAWYALLGWKKVWDYAADGEQHIVFVTSA